MTDLDALGLDEAAERVYRRLVTGGPASCEQLCQGLPVPERSALEHTLTSLAEAGLVLPVGALFAAVAPDVALDALAADRAASLAGAQQAITALSEQFRGRRARPDPDLVVEGVLGAAAVVARIRQLGLLARDEVRQMDTAASTLRRAPGVGHRAILVDCAATTCGGDGPREVTIRRVNAVPVRMVLCDERVALLLAAPDRALLLRQSALIRALSELFEITWDAALPGPAPGPGPDDLEILSLLATGATDAAIARQLGTSARTIRRRVHDLMGRVGVTTRLQLGQEAVGRSWI